MRKYIINSTMSEAKKLIVNEINKCDFSTKEPFDKISCDELPFPFSKKKLLISYKYIKRKGESKEEIITSLKNYAIIRLEQTDNISTVATVKSFSKRKKFSLVDGLNIAVTFGFSAMFILTFYLMFDERPFFFFNIFLPIIVGAVLYAGIINQINIIRNEPKADPSDRLEKQVEYIFQKICCREIEGN